MTTPYNGASELVEDGVNGWLVDPTSESDIRTHMSEAIHSRDKLPSMGSSAEARVQTLDTSLVMENLASGTQKRLIVLDRIGADAKALYGAPEKVFLDCLFRGLHAQSVRYAVMRNYESLPHSAGEGDLDMIVAPEDQKLFKALLFDAIEGAGGVIIGIAETVGFFKVCILGRISGSPRRWWGLCVDVNVGLYFRGVRLLAEDRGCLSDCRHNEIAVFSDGFAAVLGVLKEVLNNGSFPARYAPAARAGSGPQWSRIAAQLFLMGDAALEQLHALLLADPAPGDLEARCLRIRKTLLRHAMWRQPVASVVGRIRYESSKVRRYLSPPGVVIAVLGVDGIGKSTLINGILPVLKAATHGAVFVQHLRPSVLPPLARLRGKADVPVGRAVNPHGSRPSGIFGSLFRLSYLTLDYILGYWLKIRPKIAKQPGVVIYDRYAYDLALDPRRFRIGLHGRVAGWFASLAPKPDLILCLHAASEDIAARKQELPLEETRRQVEALRDFARKEPRVVLITADGSADDVKEQVLQTLHDFFARRAKNACKQG